LGTPSNLSVSVLSVGWTPLAVSPSTIGGTNATDFVVADDACAGQTLAFGVSCAIAVLDIPTATGARNATLSITDTARDSPPLVSLLGGVGPPQVKFDPAIGPPALRRRADE